MAYIQKNTPPPNKVLTFSVRDFSGGLNNRSDQLNDNEASSIINMEFVDETLLEKRRGQTYFDEFVTPLLLFISMNLNLTTSPDVLIKATESNVYVNDVLIGSVAGKINGVNHNGRYVFADGNKLYAYGTFPQVDFYICKK